MKPAALIHAGSVDEEGNIDLETISRIEAAVTLLDNHEAANLIVSAGEGTIVKVHPDGFQQRLGYTDKAIGHQMVNKLARLGVSARFVKGCYYGRDTVGEIYFSKELVLVPNEWRELYAVTSDWHVPRVKYLHEFILGPGYRTSVVSVPSVTITSPRMEDIKQREINSIRLFNSQFFGIDPGDSKGIEKVLYEKHLLYKDLPEIKKRRIYT